MLDFGFCKQQTFSRIKSTMKKKLGSHLKKGKRAVKFIKFTQQERRN